MLAQLKIGLMGVPTVTGGTSFEIEMWSVKVVCSLTGCDGGVDNPASVLRSV